MPSNPNLIFSIPCRWIGEQFEKQQTIEPYWIGVEVQGTLPALIRISVLNKWFGTEGTHRLAMHLIPPSEWGMGRYSPPAVDHDFSVQEEQNFVQHCWFELLIGDAGVWQVSIECDGVEVQSYPLRIQGE